MALGSTVRQLREASGLTQTQLAERAGMDQQALAALEKRDSKTSSFAPNLALALGVSISRLFGGTQEEKESQKKGLDELVEPEEILQLIALYGNATKDGREHIMRMARIAEKRSDSGQSTAAGDQL